MSHNYQINSIWNWKTYFERPPVLYKVSRVCTRYYIFRKTFLGWLPVSRGFLFRHDAMLHLRVNMMFR